jgi:excisionase family DNA binding protein
MPSTTNSGPDVPASTGSNGPDEWLTTDQVAEEFGLNRETIRRWIRSGRLPASRDAGGRTLWIRRGDFVDATGRGESEATPRHGDRPARAKESTPRIAGEPVTIAVPGDRTRLVAD